jgi:hypothetical protein
MHQHARRDRLDGRFPRVRSGALAYGRNHLWTWRAPLSTAEPYRPASGESQPSRSYITKLTPNATASFTREVFAEVPPRVEYAITRDGHI